MPIYEFKCPECGKVTEKILPITSKVKTIVCPAYPHSGEDGDTSDPSYARRVDISLPAAPQFKGDGWTPKHHGGDSHIGGVPVKKGDDPNEIAKRVVESNGGPKGFTRAVQEAK